MIINFLASFETFIDWTQMPRYTWESYFKQNQ